jgi:hypothetical protein
LTERPLCMFFSGRYGSAAGLREHDLDASNLPVE